jgi:ParB family transcriptional regulator, chromosome partitioning protein
MARDHAGPRARGALGERLRDVLFDTSENFPRVVELDLDRIRPNPHQPRKTLDEEGLRELASSIERHGLVNPITVREEEDGTYTLASGQRRLRAHELLGRRTIFAILTTGNPDELALIENLQREDLRPLEEAESLAALQERYGYTHEELAGVIGKARNTVTSILALNTLPARIKEECPTSDRVSKSVLIEIAQLRDEDAQLRLWERVKSGHGTVRDARAQKERGEVRDNLTPTAGLLAAGRSFVRRLERQPTEDLVANRDQYLELLELTARIDDRMARHEAGAAVLRHRAEPRIERSPTSDV